jgi:hypothetical protein
MMPPIVTYVLLCYVGMLEDHPNTSFAPAHNLSHLNLMRGGGERSSSEEENESSVSLEVSDMLSNCIMTINIIEQKLHLEP